MIPVIIQARLGSTRLPGKILKPIKGRPMIRMMVERLESSRRGTIVMVAVPHHDYVPVFQALEDTNAIVYACGGDENDVVARYRSVLTSGMCHILQPKFFVRLCADSPLIDPVLLDWMIGQYDGGLLTNANPRTFPAGQCIEIMSTQKFLNPPDGNPWTDSDREHVMPWWYRNSEFKNVTCPDGDYSHKSMVVDTQEDFDRVRNLVQSMGRPHWSYGWKELAEMIP